MWAPYQITLWQSGIVQKKLFMERAIVSVGRSNAPKCDPKSSAF